MKFLSMLNGNWVSSWKEFLNTHGVDDTFRTWLVPLMDTLSIVLWVILALVGAAGGIYAVYVGIKMARADSAEAREENKKRLINIIITMIVVIVLILIFNVILPGLISVFQDYDPGFGQKYDENGNPITKSTAVQTAVTAAKVFLGLPM